MPVSGAWVDALLDEWRSERDAERERKADRFWRSDPSDLERPDYDAMEDDYR